MDPGLSAMPDSMATAAINSAAAVAAIYMLVMLVKAVSGLVEQLRRKPEGTGVPLAVHTDHSAPLVSQTEKLDHILRILQDLYKMHDQRDAEGRPVWYSTPVVAAAKDHFTLQQQLATEMRSLQRHLQDLHSDVRSIMRRNGG